MGYSFYSPYKVLTVYTLDLKIDKYTSFSKNTILPT